MPQQRYPLHVRKPRAVSKKHLGNSVRPSDPDAYILNVTGGTLLQDLEHLKPPAHFPVSEVGGVEEVPLAQRSA